MYMDIHIVDDDSFQKYWHDLQAYKLW